VKVAVRNGKIYKLVDEKTPRYFMVPFKDRLGGVIGLGEKDLATDKLFINNGPDALYKVNLSLRYIVSDIGAFFQYRDNIADLAIKAINVDLREYADEGHALDIVKDYQENESLILGLLNKSVEKYSIEVVFFKINYVEPVGKR